ncbi:hypothetical protein, partial [Burkholderia multivorans]|uniref:hypothetical protein n=1 Tax=Burkholderia multivorans TaxID=87883 RepID=UPI0028702655
MFFFSCRPPLPAGEALTTLVTYLPMGVQDIRRCAPVVQQHRRCMQHAPVSSQHDAARAPALSSVHGYGCAGACASRAASVREASA